MYDIQSIEQQVIKLSLCLYVFVTCKAKRVVKHSRGPIGNNIDNTDRQQFIKKAHRYIDSAARQLNARREGEELATITTKQKAIKAAREEDHWTHLQKHTYSH